MSFLPLPRSCIYGDVLLKVAFAVIEHFDMAVSGFSFTRHTFKEGLASIIISFAKLGG